MMIVSPDNVLKIVENLQNKGNLNEIIKIDKKQN